MKPTAMLLGVGLLAAAVTSSTPTQCTQDTTQQELYKKACVYYKTVAGDSPYSLAKRFYGKAYMSRRLEEANKEHLQDNGFFKPDVVILVPPDDRGRSVDVSRPRTFKY